MHHMDEQMMKPPTNTHNSLNVLTNSLPGINADITSSVVATLLSV